MIRNPDGAYVIEDNDNITIIILEVKFQKVEGSTLEKMWALSSFKQEYTLLFGKKFNIEYILIINSFIYNKLIIDNNKFKFLRQIYKENNIYVINGSLNDY